jgi:predicted nucleic acid-binding protein
MGARLTSRSAQFIDQLSGVRRAALDTNAWIYFLNDQEPWLSPVRRVLELAAGGSLAIGVPGVVLMELMVNAFRSGGELEQRRIETLVDGTQFIRQLPMSRQVLMASAEIRGKLGARIADAMVMGSAAVSGADVIIGNDSRFKMLQRAEDLRMTTVPGARLPQYLHLDDFVD